MSQTFIIARPRVVARASSNQNVLSRWIQRLDIWLTRRQARKELCQLDDRMLADVGISREDVGFSRKDALWKAGMLLP
jgi:uncharacterized protein YjiS (DUF1127 family)